MLKDGAGFALYDGDAGLLASGLPLIFNDFDGRFSRHVVNLYFRHAYPVPFTLNFRLFFWIEE